MANGSHAYEVVVLGSSNLDLVASVERLPSPGETVLGTNYAEHAGGKGLNQAVACRRAGADTAFITSEGIAAYVTDYEGPTGRALISVDEQGENSIVVIPGANAELSISVVDAHRDVISRAGVLLCQLEVPLDAVEAALAIAKVGGARTILNPAPATRLNRSVLQLCDVIMPNQHEVALLGGATSLLESGVSIVVITLGARGIKIVTSEGELQIPPFAVRAIDTTGAGDAACGALATALAHGSDITTAARRASAAGALAATKKGAVPSLPTQHDIDALVN